MLRQSSFISCLIAFALFGQTALASEPDDCCKASNGKIQASKSNIQKQPVLLVQGANNKQTQSQAGSLIAPQDRKLRPMVERLSITGEVVDTWCYASQVMGSGRGDVHKPCGLACGHGGVTMGIVDDQGTLYIAAKSKGYTGCKELLLPFMAKRVTATGWLATKGGSKIMKIQKVELAK